MTALTEQDEPMDAAIASLNAATPIATEITWAERLESLKAGLLGALSAGLLFSALMLVNGWLSLRLAQLGALPIGTNSLRLLVSGVIAAFSGFLFGVTYRYIIRQDQNPHLKSGAVLAFGLVRGLAQVEGKLDTSIALVPLALLVVESLLLFMGVRLILDGALWGGWVKPFGTRTTTVDSAADASSASHPYSVKSSKSG